MIDGLLGKKIGMTQIFSDEGNIIPVTVIEAGICKVVQVKSKERDGYNAVQLGFQEIPEKRVKKPIKGHFDKSSIKPTRYLREIRVDSVEDIQTGQEVAVDIFNPGDYVDVAGISKGKGFAGVMKRHGFSGTSSATHGSHEYFRHPGSIGASADPSRVFKGTKLPGHMGSERVTVQNLRVIRIIKEQNVLLVKGSLPGSKGRLLFIKKSKKKKKAEKK
ncbi:MAG TPA: 50S ribosomal protein L3 [Nitrospinota bacterium]|nr:50S ribosomal protein L3 [Nitrospinota bacterium]